MGTRWQGMLMPLNSATGDGRIYNNITHRDLPLPMRWQRNDESGHAGPVVVGRIDQIEISSNQIYGRGTLFDDATSPRLKEDATEVRELMEQGIIGPSVDLRDFDELDIEIIENGDKPQIQVNAGRISAATIVQIPAFEGMSGPFELTQDDCPEGQHKMPDGKCMDDEDMPGYESMTAAAPLKLSIDLFADPQFTEPTPITRHGFDGIRGHVATWGTCHVGIRGMCSTAPESAAGYAYFHRYQIETSRGQLPVGRLTAGNGNFSDSCRCHRHSDDHACDELSFTAAVGHYDQLDTVAWVVAGEDEHGIWISGVLHEDVTEADLKTLSRQKVSGDWREVAGNLELVEVLALATEEPGLPVRARSISGRQMTLIAAGAIMPTTDEPESGIPLPRPIFELVETLSTTLGLKQLAETLQGDPKKPYGDVTYADPGYQEDGVKRYPIDTEAHVRAAWSYINQRKNAAKYSADEVSKIKGRIRSAGRKYGIDFEEG